MRKSIILIAVCFIVVAAGLILIPNSLIKVNAARLADRPTRSTSINAPSQRQIVNSPGKTVDLLGTNHFSSLSLASISQEGSVSTNELWQDSKVIASQNGAQQNPTHTMRLNGDALARLLQQAPMEFTPAAQMSRVVMSLPMPDGRFSRFRIEESPIMEPELASRLPDVKTYKGQGIDDPTASTRFDWTPQGFHAIVLSTEDAVYIEPASRQDTSAYIAQFGQDQSGHKSFECGVNEHDVADAVARGVYARRKNGAPSPEVSNGATLRTYRLAVATTGEWFSLYGGGSVANAQTAITSLINLVDAIYEREVAIRFTLVNNTSIIFTNSATDPYSTNAADSTTLNENQTTLDANVGDANYDVGHVLGGITGLGAGSSSFSGLATLGVACATGSKAKGVSTMGNNPAKVTDAIFVTGVAHEIGHEFSATHTFNTNQAPCGAQRDGTSSYEVGGGTTMMAYSICGSDNTQPQTAPYFHVRSLEQIVNYATTSGTCATTSATGNTAPTVTGPGNFTIPISTPFRLSASATDTNGPLTYSWEEYDLGAATTGVYVDDGSVPLFRSYGPTSGGFLRYFPSLPFILNNANNPPGTYTLNGTTFLTGELLPTTSRTMNFQVVVRDNQTNGGAINTATSVLTVTNLAGPFLVTAPNTAVAWTGGTVQTVTWSVNNTNNAPVSAANVQISLSTDGGLSFPVTLAASTANDGTENVAVPNGISTSTARVKVEAVGNIFFDISDVNFSIQPGDGCPAVTDFNPKAGNVGTTVTITGNNFTGVTGVSFNGTPATSFTVDSNTQITATVPSGATGGVITLTKGGCANYQTAAGFNVCPNAASTLLVDDGSLDSGAKYGATNYFVNRLTPGAYPATLTDVKILFGSFLGFTNATPIKIIAGSNASGSPDYTTFQSFDTTVGTLDTFNTYTLKNPIKITSGDFIVGFVVDPAGLFPAELDTNSIQNRSYFSNNLGTTFSLDTSGNYPIRATMFTGACSGPTAAPATISGTVNSSDGTPVAGVTMTLGGAKSARTITDAQGNYHFDNVDTDNFYVVTPSFVNYRFSPVSRSFSLLSNKSDAVFTAVPDAIATANAIDTTDYFVRQQYLDFLGREPDEGGLSYWTARIAECGADSECTRQRRIEVSAAFFYSEEYQQTGDFIYRMYRAGLGRQLNFAEFSAARSAVVAGGDLARNRASFADSFVRKAEFTSLYSGATSADSFVTLLLQTMRQASGVDLSSQRQALIARYNQGSDLNQARALALRDAVEATAFKQAEYNRSFVLIEYFGYLKRDADSGGYQFWLDVLNNRVQGNYRSMVCAFLTSSEYQRRFSTVATHSNSECGQ